MRIHDLGEFPLIDRLAALVRETERLPAAGRVVLGIDDDAAVLELPPDRELVATVDALVEGVHFRRETTAPEDLGWKALAVNASDLGAMGARPLAALLTLALPPETEAEWLEALYAGLAEAAEQFRCAVAGGDTVRQPERISLTVTALGTIPAGRAVRRAGARAGDLLCVTGTLGASAAGLALLEAGGELAERSEFAPLLCLHRRPEPPVEAGAALAEAGLARAMLDLSDGLASDLQHLLGRPDSAGWKACATSAGGKASATSAGWKAGATSAGWKACATGARVERERLPISLATREAAAALGEEPERFALHGGEDYELLFAVAPDDVPRVPPLLAPFGVVATIIGELGGTEALLVESDGRERPLAPAGFRHFG